MVLARDIYRALEDIVGPENSSDEPAVLDCYSFHFPWEYIPTGYGERFGFRPEAVVLPGSTEEVQAIVKTCNRYKIKFKAYSTGWNARGAPGREGVVQLDLRRMNRILEINERNMYAVLEPYVISAQLQAELMKRGLNCHIITAGSNSTAFAPGGLGQGTGWSSVSTSNHRRNILAVEWVLPTGELLRLGSIGSRAGWFSGDGPGPSLRGLMRGITGAVGGMGVFTKGAVKVYHWPGPPVPPIEGVSPSYTLKQLPRKKAYCLLFPSWDKLADAGNKIAESEIAYIVAKVPPQVIAWTLAPSNQHAAELFPKILKAMEGQHGFLVAVISANSQREFDYRDKVLRHIVTETGLKSLSFFDGLEIQGELMWHFFRVGTGSRNYFRPGGGVTNPFGASGTWDFVVSKLETVNASTRKYLEKGLIMNTVEDNVTAKLFEYGHFAYAEPMYQFDPTDPESLKGATELMRESHQSAVEKMWSVPIGGAPDVTLGTLGDYNLWLKKIKQAFDPNIATDPSTYYVYTKTKDFDGLNEENERKEGNV